MRRRDHESVWSFSAVVLVGLSGAAPAAQAECTFLENYGYRPDQNDTLDMEMTCDIKGTGALQNTPGAGYEMTGISIALKPHNGALKVWGKSLWRYTPKAAGSDAFSTKQCATLHGDASGCSTLNYKVTIK